MKTLEKILNKLDGKLLSIERNTENGAYELNIGLPSKWVYKSSDMVEIDEVHKTKEGVLLKVYSEDKSIVIDDLIEFVNVIIETNEEISNREARFNEMMEKRRKELEDEFNKFEDELEELRESSFKKFKNDDEKKEVKKPKKNTKSNNTKEESKIENLEELEDKLSK